MKGGIDDLLNGRMFKHVSSSTASKIANLEDQDSDGYFGTYVGISCNDEYAMAS